MMKEPMPSWMGPRYARSNVRRTPLDRLAVLFASIADELLRLLLDPHDRQLRDRRLRCFLRSEVVDPNRPRAATQQFALVAPIFLRLLRS
ncbi:MAG: hypothetical protein IPK60_16975 [Sandaracinaceae bacterium]|nr:hypothetical protein [Sandaracinaceae bacterium]